MGYVSWNFYPRPKRYHVVSQVLPKPIVATQRGVLSTAERWVPDEGFPGSGLVVDPANENYVLVLK